ncbi:PadR family transcriptional regulator [Kurthia sibirica]|uniref:Transcription regulator PadR N-terminal domain-containing protein n=1 Tax=Kurthia sibirica TaxID=202750 RepID=A0A2U3AN50_9BACL|nr:PadR family transcriptional regulator [Kurthia sibirica]PWI25973.1 hypothetical protein DEX24_05430 [Kurthia sibirica]GEK34994.1 hypothetical protein KSI01_25270 [Kurthia sibirica]
MFVKLFILGILSKKNFHPYMILKIFERVVEIDPSFKISDGKLYYHFDSLLKKNYITAVETVALENRPDKTVYTITESGQQYLRDLIYQSFDNILLTNVQSLYIPILFLDYVKLDQVVIILDEVIVRESQRIGTIERVAEHPELTNIAHLQLIFSHASKSYDDNLTWLAQLRDSLKKHLQSTTERKKEPGTEQK